MFRESLPHLPSLNTFRASKCQLSVILRLIKILYISAGDFHLRNAHDSHQQSKSKKKKPRRDFYGTIEAPSIDYTRYIHITVHTQLVMCLQHVDVDGACEFHPFYTHTHAHSQACDTVDISFPFCSARIAPSPPRSNVGALAHYTVMVYICESIKGLEDSIFFYRAKNTSRTQVFYHTKSLSF